VLSGLYTFIRYVILGFLGFFSDFWIALVFSGFFGDFQVIAGISNPLLSRRKERVFGIANP